MNEAQTVYVVTCMDQDGYHSILAVWSSQALADAFVDRFVEAHKEDPFWRLDDIVIESIVLDESKF
jgi:hypothetical protein